MDVRQDTKQRMLERFVSPLTPSLACKGAPQLARPPLGTTQVAGASSDTWRFICWVTPESQENRLLASDLV